MNHATKTAEAMERIELKTGMELARTKVTIQNTAPWASQTTQLRFVAPLPCLVTSSSSVPISLMVVTKAYFVAELPKTMAPPITQGMTTP